MSTPLGDHGDPRRDGDGEDREPAVLVGVVLRGHDAREAEASLVELERLADTAGADAVASLLQRRGFTNFIT